MKQGMLRTGIHNCGKGVKLAQSIPLRTGWTLPLHQHRQHSVILEPLGASRRPSYARSTPKKKPVEEVKEEPKQEEQQQEVVQTQQNIEYQEQAQPQTAPQQPVSVTVATPSATTTVTQKPGNPPDISVTVSSSSEAVLTAGAGQIQKQAVVETDGLVTEVYTEEEIVYDKPITLQSVVQDTRTWVQETNLGKTAAFTVGAVLLGTFFIACQRYYKKYQSASNQRKRQVNRNKQLIDEINKYLPDQRSKLSSGALNILKIRLGFSPIEMFRKYLWYLLRERKFDQSAVDDLVALKLAAGMSDDDVAEAIRERSQRVYDKYGTLMMNTEGMTDAGIQRKATCRALFRKLLYLTEFEPLVKQGTPAADKVDLGKIFGATKDDMDRLRIVTLYEDDIDLERALNATTDDEDEQPPQSKQL